MGADSFGESSDSLQHIANALQRQMYFGVLKCVLPYTHMTVHKRSIWLSLNDFEKA